MKPVFATRPTLAPVATLGLLLLWLTACAQIDPYQRPGMWQPDNVNDGNIAAELQDKRDLVRGHGAAGPATQTGAWGVERLWQDKVKPLPDSASAAPTGTDAPPAAGGH